MMTHNFDNLFSTQNALAETLPSNSAVVVRRRRFREMELFG